MRTISNLFARSPFGPLQEHMARVMECTNKIRAIFEAQAAKDFAGVKKLAKEISELEHMADLTKNDIRNNLPKGLFLPVDRGHLLEILSVQDSIADKCEDIGVLLSLHDFTIPKAMKEDFQNFLDKNIETIEKVNEIMQKLDELLESSFGGSEAKNVQSMVEEVAYMEHEADKMQRKLLQATFSSEKNLSYSEFFLMVRIFEEMSGLSNNAEKLANRIRMTLELK